MRYASLLGAAASLCLVVGTTACGGEDEQSEEDLVDDVSRSLQGGGDGFDEATADCFAQIVVQDVGMEELRDVDLTADEPPEELQDEFTAAVLRGNDECDPAAAGG